MMSKKLILVIIAVLILAFVIYQVFLKKEEPVFSLAEVSRGDISQEVSETGQVIKGGEINLSFKSAGKIEKIYVEVGQAVESNQALAKIDITDLLVELQQAKAALSLAQAELDKLLAGSSQEEIKIAQTKVKNMQIALDTANQNLKDSYEDALNILDDSYLKAYNSFNVVDLTQRTYFTGSDQESLKVRENKDKIENKISQAQSYLNVAKANPEEKNIDAALTEMKDSLSDIYDALGVIREACQAPNYRNIISSTDKTSLDNQRTYINTALTNIINSQQLIISAELAINSAEGQLLAVQDELALIEAPPRQEDIDLYQAQVNQAQAQVQLLENQVGDATLYSPVAGQITKVNKEIGEMVQPMLQDVVISILPASPFEIEADIYEEDVVKISIGNQVDISLVAFPEQTFKGKVISIEPAQKLIEGVVYYEINVSFEGLPDGAKPGMTADLVIKTASKENVLIIPEDAIQKKDGKTIVKVLKEGSTEEREIEAGLFGSDDMVEVISGLEEGEKVILD